jgi:CelD/BcsL family acetyltransferase involved in cellulose biosynthesis
LRTEQELEHRSWCPQSGKSLTSTGTGPDSEPDRERRRIAATADSGSTSVPSGSLFHESWWLAAVTQGQFEEARVLKGGRVVGRLPFVIDRKMGFTTLRMPAFTHVLGPLVDAGQGKEQTQLLRRLSIVRDLLDQLPRFDFFKQALYRVPADGLAFQDRGFEIMPQFTFVIDCRRDPREIWEGMHSKTRQHIRRAEEKFKVVSVEDPRTFMRFYRTNTERRRRVVPTGFGSFETLFHECRLRDCGEILSATRLDGTPTAMIYIVWGHGTMYYLLSSRAGEPDDNGSVNLLIWTAIKYANERGLLLDLDGVISSGTASFLSGFGGHAKARWIAQRASFAYATLQFAKRRIIGGAADDTLAFT